MIEREELYRRRCVRKVIEVVDAVAGYWRAQSPIILVNETTAGLLLLASWLRCERDFLFQCLEEMGVGIADFRRRIDNALNQWKISKDDRHDGRLAAYDGPLFLRELTLEWLDRAAEEAQRLRQDYLGVEHLLLAFLRPEGSRLAVLLSDCGIDRERLTEAVLAALRRGRPSHREPGDESAARGAIENIAAATPLDAYAPVGMPKRFSIAIMMAWITLFAMAFSVLKGVDAPPGVFGSVTILMLGIGVAQMWLFGGKKPRLASVVAGAVVLCVEVAGLNILTGCFSVERSSIVLRVVTSIVLIIPCVPLGAFFGYLLGGLTAGIVLTLNYLENRKGGGSAAEIESDGVGNGK